jgi:EPS-associated MarR family transcriptional regulator
MIEHTPKEEILSIIKEIESDPTSTQRELSQKLDISLGKTNYLLKELIKKGFIKMQNFTSNPDKISKIHYYLTKRGIEHKIHLMQLFLKKKESEYIKMKEDWDKLMLDNPTSNIL